MATIADDRDLLLKKELDNYKVYMSEKLDKIFDSIKSLEIQMAKLPEKLRKEFDNCYADKNLENDVRVLREKNEARTYEWIKFGIASLVGGATMIIGNIIVNRF